MLASYNLQSTFASQPFYNAEITPWIIGGILSLVMGWCLLGGGNRIVKVTSTWIHLWELHIFWYLCWS